MIYDKKKKKQTKTSIKREAKYQEEEGEIKVKYTRYATDRDNYLRRGRESSLFTIPTLLPQQSSTGATEVTTPFQSIGAEGVNNLSSKLLMSLLPPNAPFFRLVVDNSELEALLAEKRSEAEEGLAKIERSVMQEIEVRGLRVPVAEALKQLLVTGNVLLYLPPKEKIRVFRLDRYVVERDAMGNVLEIITKESLSPLALPEAAKEIIADPDSDTPEKELDLYTCIKFTGTNWQVHQELEGIVVPGSSGTFPKNRNPFLALRFTSMDGENYGRGYVEEYLGDLKSLESLTQSIVEGSAAAAKVLFLVKPNGSTRVKTLAESPNGAIVVGDDQDVSSLQLGKQQDFAVAQQTIQMLQTRLSRVFLMNSSIRRDAERVTAQEIRVAHQELEIALGGVYAVLSQEFQLPLVELLMDKMQKEDKIPKLPDEGLKPLIVTGVEALGRGEDLNKLQQLLQTLLPLGPEVMQEINISDYISRLAGSLGIDTDGLVKTEEEKQLEKQAAEAKQTQMINQQQMGKLAERAMPEMAKQMSSEQAQQMMTQQQGPPPQMTN
tara:strand:+ start:554 stop:2203 length:1650 start_codon:yes stop_codon:yes gene_type:complete